MSDTIDTVRQSRLRDAMLHSRRPAQIIEAADTGSQTALYFPELDELDMLVPAAHGLETLIASSGAGGYSKFFLISTASTPFRPVSHKGSVTDTVIEVSDLIAGTTQADMAWVEPGATAWLPQRTSSGSRPAAVSQVRSEKTSAELRTHRLTSIQAAFGLPIQTLAEVLGVSRPNLYKWLDASKDITLHEGNTRRLAAVELLAKRWQQVSSAPLCSVMHEPLTNGQTALGMLTAEAIDTTAVTTAFSELTSRLQGQPRTRSELRAKAGFKRRPTARALQPDD